MDLESDVMIFQLRFCQNSASGQNNIVPHYLRRSINVLPTLPIEVRIQEKISDLTGLSNILLQRLRYPSETGDR